MKILRWPALLALSLAPLLASAAGEDETPNRLSRLERDAGWQLLFDGESTRGWRGFEAGGFPSTGWDVEGGCLHHRPNGGGGDVVTEAAFDRFELELEWKVAQGANSGVKYRTVEQTAGQGRVRGPEYQILDDAHAADRGNPTHRAGALYDVFAPASDVVRPAGEFNRTRIVVRDERIEHWLNGVRVVDAELSSESWRQAVANSKFRDDAEFVAETPGRILLQDHGGEVWFRSLKIRELPAAVGREVEIYDGKTLDGWRSVGDARYVADGDAILGEVDGGGQSFLLSEQSYGDFIFEVDVRPELPGNSGIQIRSHQRENGRVFGYQIEIDSSDRAWSGGLYDEARRGWLQNLESNPAGRAAFRRGDWNRYRIECVGPWIRASIDGVPTTDYFDTHDVEGMFGLQVHSGNNTKVRWRNARLWDLGRRRWVPLYAERPAKGWALEPGGISIGEGVLDGKGDGTLRCRFRVETGELEVLVRGASSGTDGSVPHEVLERDGGGWRIAPTRAGAYEAGKWNELGLCLDGGRVAVLVNGRLAGEARGPAATGRGSIAIEAAGEGGSVWLKQVEALSDPED